MFTMKNKSVILCHPLWLKKLVKLIGSVLTVRTEKRAFERWGGQCCPRSVHSEPIQWLSGRWTYQLFKRLKRDFSSFSPPLSLFHAIFSILSPKVCTQTLGIDHLKSPKINPTSGTCFLRLDRCFHRLVWSKYINSYFSWFHLDFWGFCLISQISLGFLCLEDF